MKLKLREDQYHSRRGTIPRQTDQPVQLELPQRTPQIEYEAPLQLSAPSQTNASLGEAFEEIPETQVEIIPPKANGIRRI